MTSIENIRKEVRKLSKQRGRKKYSGRVVNSCLALLARDYSIVELSEATGISHQTLRTWQKQNNKKSGVEVKRWSDEGGNILRLHFPDGRWIEGLSLADIRELGADVISKKGA